jgi:hypothetical protein
MSFQGSKLMYGSKNIKKIEKVATKKKLLLPQTNGRACVDFPIHLMGCFEIYSSTYWVSSQNMNVG